MAGEAVEYHLMSRILHHPLKGTNLLKYGRHGQPKSHYFRLSSDDSELQWDSKVCRVCGSDIAVSRISEDVLVV